MRIRATANPYTNDAASGRLAANAVSGMTAAQATAPIRKRRERKHHGKSITE